MQKEKKESAANQNGQKWIRGKYTPAQGRVSKIYNARSYDTITFRVRKDAKISKAVMEQAAGKAGLSLNAYILDTVTSRIQAEQEQEKEKG